MEDSDITYVKKCQSGDSESFAVLYDRYIQKIYRFVYYKVFDREAAEDIVADTFLKAFDRIGGYDSEKGSFSSWLYRIARNSVIDQYRSKQETANIEDAFDLGFEDRLPEKIDAKESFRQISEYLKTLSPKQREIIILRVWNDLSYKEIAEIVGGSEGAAKMMFLRSIREIRERFSPLALILLISLKS